MRIQGFGSSLGHRVGARKLLAASCLFLALGVGSLWLQACSPDETTSSLASTTSASSPLVTGGLKQEMAVAGWKIVVDGVESKTELDGAKADEGEELLVVKFTVVNSTSRPISLTVEDLSLKGEEGKSYRAIDTGTGMFALAPVAPSASASTFVVFRVPKGETGLKLHFSPFVEAPVSPREADITLR